MDSFLFFFFPLGIDSVVRDRTIVMFSSLVKSRAQATALRISPARISPIRQVTPKVRSNRECRVNSGKLTMII